MKFCQFFCKTPIWVWALLAYCIFIGFFLTKRRKAHLIKLYPVVVVLLLIKLPILIKSGWEVFGIFAFFYLIGLIFGFLRGRSVKIELCPEKNYFWLPGSYEMLFILLMFFAIKYFFGVLQAINVDLFVKTCLFEVALSGFFSGYLFGRALGITKKYFTMLSES